MERPLLLYFIEHYEFPLRGAQWEIKIAQYVVKLRRGWGEVWQVKDFLGHSPSRRYSRVVDQCRRQGGSVPRESSQGDLRMGLFCDHALFCIDMSTPIHYP